MDTTPDTAHVDAFWRLYTDKLREACERHPTEYPWYQEGALTVEYVADRMRTSVETRGMGSVNISGHVWKATARALKIKPTYQAFREYLGVKVRP